MLKYSIRIQSCATGGFFRLRFFSPRPAGTRAESLSDLQGSPLSGGGGDERPGKDGSRPLWYAPRCEGGKPARSLRMQDKERGDTCSRGALSVTDPKNAQGRIPLLEA